ncbi:er lumen protein retaining receptor, variant, partial [Protomyces lactucae-debilis]
MDLLQLTADMAHLASILILIHRIHIRKTCAGISLKTHILYLTVFITRYGDLFLYTHSIYNITMKILYLITSSYIVFLMTLSPHYKLTWYRGLDTFTITPILVLSAVLAIIITHRYTVFEVLWTCSIILESMAILPQLFHLTQVPSLPALPLSHLVALGVYRFFYVLHWMHASFNHTRKVDFTSFLFGLLQTLIWADFLWVWYNRKVIK